MAGWIKLHRALLKSNVFDNDKLLKTWVWCLLKASHQEREQMVGRQIVHLEPGQFIFGRKKASAELGYPPSTTRDVMNLLRDMGNVDIKSTNKYSIVTITNWALYQSQNGETDSKPDTQTDSKRTTDGQQMDTNKNDKNEENDKKDLKTYRRQVYDLLEFWNSKEIVVHKETDSTLKQVEKGLKKHTLDEIKTAIERYVTLYHDPSYFYKHKWTLPKFLNQSNGVPDFLDEGIRWVNYKQESPRPKFNPEFHL